MKDITIDVPVEHYLQEWCNSTLGSPIRFPKRSAENALLIQLLRKKPPKNLERSPESLTTETADSRVRRRALCSVSIVLPDNRAKRPEHYHYLDHRGESEVRGVLSNLFRIALWTDCCPLICAARGVNEGIDQWCRTHGISLDHREAVRQKFYRMRKAYLDRGIAILQVNCRGAQALAAKSQRNVPKSLSL